MLQGSKIRCRLYTAKWNSQRAGARRYWTAISACCGEELENEREEEHDDEDENEENLLVCM
jgi:hypothetical protein